MRCPYSILQNFCLMILLIGACLLREGFAYAQTAQVLQQSRRQISPRQELQAKLPNHVEVSGRRLLVNGEAYNIKGVCWNPVRRGRSHPEGLMFRHPSPADLQAIAHDFSLMRKAGINTIRTYEVITNPEVLALAAKHQLKIIVPIFNYYRKHSPDIKAQVTALAEHPTTLMWELGNEWNYNHFYNPGGNINDSRGRLKAYARLIHQMDRHHPISSSHGELPSAETLAFLPEIDIWGLNVYSGLSFGGRFAAWAKLSRKPVYFAEYGADAIDARGKQQLNLAAQAEAVHRLTTEIVSQWSSRHGHAQVLGGTVFEWNDEWWKVQGGRWDKQDQGGIAPGGGPHPDGVFNEEWWGLLTLDRHRRPAYDALRSIYTSNF